MNYKIILWCVRKLGVVVGFFLALCMFVLPKIIPTFMLLGLYIVSGLRETSVEFTDGIVFRIPDINKLWRKKDED